MIEKGRWGNLLRRIKIKLGDFFYVLSGTIYALCEKTLVLETQQSSDTEYRVYDCNHKDKNRRTDELRLDKILEVSADLHVD
jgi:mannose-6-phosphate isomerase